MSCGWTDWATKPAECASETASNAIGDAIQNMANAVMEAFGKTVASLGTMWVTIGTPNLTSTGGGSAILAGSRAPDSQGIETVLGYVMWISFAVAILSLFALSGLLAFRMKLGDGVAAVGRLGVVLSAVVLISGASALVAGLMPAGPQNAGGAALFIQSGLWWYMGAASMVSVIVGGGRMIWEQRAEPGRETVKGLLTLVVVAGAGVTVVSLLVGAADSFAVWLLNGSLSCDVTAGGTCFGDNMATLLALTTNPATGGLGALLIIILGLIAVLAAVFQIVLMVARGGMLVILVGILPLSASFTNTEMGKSWFRKCVGWLVAFILYKPAAAIVYSTAFQLVGTDVFSDDGSGLLAVLTGLMLMVIALFAMPALLRFVTPMVGAMTGGAGGAMAVGAMATLPTGAAAVGRLASGSSSTSGPSGSQESVGPSGGVHTVGASSSGATQVGQAGVGGAAGGTSAASGGAASSGAAAAGPIGVAAGAALEVGRKAGQAAAGAAQSLGVQSTGEGNGGPDGAR